MYYKVNLHERVPAQKPTHNEWDLDPNAFEEKVVTPEGRELAAKLRNPNDLRRAELKLWDTHNQRYSAEWSADDVNRMLRCGSGTSAKVGTGWC